MSRRLRQVKSEMPGRFINRKIKVERSKTPLRFSRRLRQLPPEDGDFCPNVNKQKLRGKQVISQESSIQFTQNRRGNNQRRLHYPRRARHSKEVISILSAPRLCNRRPTYSDKKVIEIPVIVRGSSCRANILVKNQNPVCRTYTTPKFCTHIKQEQSPGTESILQKRKRYVLEVLNKGDMKDIEKLPTVGSKTAERILLFRQLKGPINKISELAKMPKFPKKRFHNFVAQNFLKVD